MSGRSSAPLTAAALLLGVLLLAAPAAEALTCGQVVSFISQCLQYARGPGTSPPPAACCSGVKGLNNAAQSTPDRQTACNCLKKAAGTVTGLKAGLVAGIPQQCGVNVPYAISTSTDCSKVR
ncbi:non-specific lipid-transfer protein 4.1-like [Ananas comosus]|uniref:Non-specific lipid-transfer protein n=1 Tax=Ananas comosus TaxID=4615 RepID=A0A6P5FYS0_ANACO|nr:non-specific lipid-transfer protein 4.1-like [Ananas comosus]